MIGLTALYIFNNGETEIRDGGLVFYLPRGFSTNTPFDKNVKLIEISKSMDSFDYNNQILVNRLRDKIESIYDFNSDIRFIINFAIEESKNTNGIINFYKTLLHNKPLIFLTNDINYLGKDGFIFYNPNQWVTENCEVEFVHALDIIKRADLGTIKKKFMFLNNHFSPIRFDILKLIHKNNKQSEGNISFNLIDFNDIHFGIESEESFLKQCDEHNIKYPMYYDTYPGLSKISEVEQQKKKILGINHIGTVPMNYRIYFESFFEIITETQHLLKMSGAYTSEKIYKALKSGNPFVYYGKKEVKYALEKMGFTFNSPIYFFGEGEEFMNHLETILNNDMEWYNDVQRTYLKEYIHNVMEYSNLQHNQSKKIVKYIYK
jgi:hypothetical protein